MNTNNQKKDLIFESTITNDRIDIHADPDVHIKNLKPRNKNELRIEIEGASVDYSVVNAIRRTILMSIPIYGFNRSNIFIDVEKSKHMYNNDFIYNQIETLPIFDIPNNFDLENPEIFLPNEVIKNIFGSFMPENELIEQDISKFSDSNKKLLKIELTINIKNNTNTDKFVSTHDAILRIDGKISNSYKIRKPICILVLKPTEEISLRAEANLGIAAMHAAYEATTNAIHEEITPTKYHLWYETLEQLDKKVIFTKACIILTKKLQNLMEFIEKKYGDKNVSDLVEIRLHGENHTLGNLLATTLQKCQYVEKAGYQMPHPFINEIVISYKIIPKSKYGTIKVLLICIDYLVRLFQNITNLAEKIA
jgi:DNA-directed RNA polymerase subunit L